MILVTEYPIEMTNPLVIRQNQGEVTMGQFQILAQVTAEFLEAGNRNGMLALPVDDVGLAGCHESV